ncbi:flagellar protein FlgN [Niveispirillum irakense]|uniref:flagellar protein FlgN n=1 Tax=Niveispirillum irakense TaxID=34011 RepID=UPI00040D6F02|nr:flagellar protein FlgN [Niveispirillum irakense]
MTAENRTDALIEAMERLTSLYEVENKAILDHNIPALGHVAEQKPLLVRTYEDCVRSIRADPTALTALDEAGRQRLRERSDAFVDATLVHARLVRAATQVTQSMVNTMVGAVNRARAEDGAYTRRGGTVMPAAYARKTAPSTSVNYKL